MEKKLFAFFILIFLGILSTLSVNAVTTITLVPASSSTIGGLNTLLNATVSVASGIGYNCSFYLSSPSTANSTATLIGSANVTNSSQLSTWTYVNSSTFEDSNDYTLLAQCTNGTAITGSNTGIIIDNTVPTAPTLSPVTNTNLNSATTQTLSATVNNEQTTGCTYTIGRNGASSGSDYSSGTATYSGNSCSFTKTISSTADNGVYTWTITASDGTNSSISSANLNVQLPGTSGGIPLNDNGSSITIFENNNWIYLLLGLLVILGVIYLITR